MEVRRSVVLLRPVEVAFDVIEQAEHYPQFIPGCTGAEILERTDQIVAARLSLRYAGVTIQLVTRNPKRRPDWLKLRMVQGPFRRFEGEWNLTRLKPDACRIEFTLHCELGEALLVGLAAPIVRRFTDAMVDAYVARAEAIAVPAPLHAPPPPEPEPIMNDEIYQALRPSRLAAELTDEQCRTLAAVMTLRDLREGEVLVREGAPDEHFYLIASGVLGVVKNAGTSEQVTLNTLTAGDFAGELSWLDGEERYASLVAAAPTRVIGLERTRLEALLTKDPVLVYRVMRAIVRVVHQLQRRLWMQQSELANYIYKQHGRY
jgi:ribosome-associated toxin RatA of RatAB toxin-antitoxin module/CRP-like cAMP-binding protein